MKDQIESIEKRLELNQKEKDQLKKEKKRILKTTYLIQLDREDHTKYKEITKDLGIHMSTPIKKFIKDYIAEYEK